MPKKNPATGDPILDALRAERERRGWSQTELAQRLGRRTYNTPYQWESGANEPTLSSLREWAEALGFEVTLKPWEPAEQPESRVRTGYQCAIGGEACPGHSSKWLMCDPATRTAGEVKIRPRMTDGCGPEHTYRVGCELRPEGSDRA